MKTYRDLVNEAVHEIREIFPWDLQEHLQGDAPPLLVDVREPDEFARAHIAGAINVPRGILESACDWGYQETVPALAAARQAPVVLVCRSGNRSALATKVLQEMGYTALASLKTGLRGWNDYEQPLVDGAGNPVDIDDAEALFTDQVTEEQLGPSTSRTPSSQHSSSAT